MPPVFGRRGKLPRLAAILCPLEGQWHCENSYIITEVFEHFSAVVYNECEIQAGSEKTLSPSLALRAWKRARGEK